MLKHPRGPRPTPPLRALAVASLLAAATAPALAEEPAAGSGVSLSRPHELGWVCMAVTDTRIVQASAFNRDARKLSVTVPRARFFVEPAPAGAPGGRVCIPTVVAIGDGDAPEETLIFERRLNVGGVQRSAQMELVLTPEDPGLDEVTLTVVGLAHQWTERDGVATFSVDGTVAFQPRPFKGFLGEGDGMPPNEVFVATAAALRFTETCAPASLVETTVGSYAIFDSGRGQVVPRGVEPMRFEAGTRVSRCEGLSVDPNQVAIALPADVEGDPQAVSWFLVSRQTRLDLADPDDPTRDHLGMRYQASAPLGGYHLCRQPMWTSALVEDVKLEGLWTIEAGQWRQMTAAGVPVASLPRGTPATLLDERDSWALIRVEHAGRGHVFAVPSKLVALPSGPTKDVLELAGGFCAVQRGVWRGTANAAQAFRTSQDTPGAELAGLWLEVPAGTYVLQLCQTSVNGEAPRGPRDLTCEPVYVGGAQGGPNERFVLVRYAGSVIAMRERDLRDRTTGAFTLRRERPWFWQADRKVLRDANSPWVLGLETGARLSFANHDHFGWNAFRARVQRLTEGSLGFEGGVGFVVDGLGPLIELSGGVQMFAHRFTEVPVELRLGVLGRLDLRVDAGGGLGFDVLGKAQLRWLNEIAPVSFELGLNLGYGGTFGADGAGSVSLGMPIGVAVEVVDF
jgi:hypothetical protein